LSQASSRLHGFAYRPAWFQRVSPKDSEDPRLPHEAILVSPQEYDDDRSGEGKRAGWIGMKGCADSVHAWDLVATSELAPVLNLANGNGCELCLAELLV
jgi:hypothetical protein